MKEMLGEGATSSSASTGTGLTPEEQLLKEMLE